MYHFHFVRFVKKKASQKGVEKCVAQEYLQKLLKLKKNCRKEDCFIL